MQPLNALLSKPEQHLMRAVIGRPEMDYGTVELLTQMGTSRGAGSAVLKRWLDAGLLRERKLGNQRRLSANPRFVLFPELRRIVLKTVGLAEPLVKALLPLADRLTEAFVFGSIAAGTDSSSSDIDLAVVGDVGLFDVSPLLDAAQEDLGRPIHVNVYSKAEWSSDDPIIAKIMEGPRLDLMEALRGQAN